MLRSLLILLVVVCRPAGAFCFDAAGAKYHVDPLLIKAITIGESALNPGAVNINRDVKTGKEASRDFGLMQINSTHIPELIHEGIISNKNELLTRPCLNVQIGTRILAEHFQVCGISWDCLGSYNAGFRQDRHESRESYANRIYAIYRRLMKQERGIVL